MRSAKASTWSAPLYAGDADHQVRYEPQKHSDAEILLYFDAETFL
jgi:hypothetical protein